MVRFEYRGYMDFGPFLSTGLCKMVYSRPMGERSRSSKAPGPRLGRSLRGPSSLPVLGQAPTSPERKDAARNRAKILEAARELLDQRPIGEICMDELARRAGVGKGTVYRRFADRASLCRALLDEDSKAVQAQVLDGFGLDLDAPWVSRALALLEALFQFTVRNASLLSEARAFERGCPTRFDHPAHVWQRDTLGLYLHRAIDGGEIPSLDPEVAAEQLLAGLEPDLIRWHQARGRGPKALLERYRRLWFNTIGA